MKIPRGCELIPWLLAALGILLLTAGPVSADANAPATPVSITLNPGDSYVIKDIKPDTTPSVKVIDNPHAMLLGSPAQGQLTVLGAGPGQWVITVNLASGLTAYTVTVNKGIVDSKHPLKPGAEAAGYGMGSSSAGYGMGGVPAAAPAAPLDKGAGPVAMAAAGAPSASDMSAAASDTGARVVSMGHNASPSPATPAAGAAPALDTAAAAVEAPASAAPAPQPGQAEIVASQAVSAAAESAPLKRLKTDPSATKLDNFVRSGGPSMGVNYLPDGVIELMADTSEIFDFPRRIRRISIADTKVADIQVVNPYQINLIGHKAGFTTLAVWDDQGHYQERRIRVNQHGDEQVLLSAIVAELDRSKIENQGINISAALSNYGVSLVGLPGAVATPYNSQTSINSSSSNPGSSGSSSGQSLPFGGQLIPLLLSQSLTYGLAAQNSNVQTQTFFQYLETHNLGKVLAEPHLLADSGQQAKFLSGGEIPIVISQALNTSIVFKQYGTSIVFVPTVIGPDNIDLQVKPEVSQPDYTHGVQLFGFTVPAFVTRKADTDVRLRNGQTLIIAGLLLDNKTSIVNKVPYLGDIPYMGALFRTTGYMDSKTDLVMSVTPRIVRPLPDGAAPVDPTDVGPLTRAEVRTQRLPVYNAARPRF